MIDEGIQDVGRPAAAGTEEGLRSTGVPAAADSNFSPDGAPIGFYGSRLQPNPQVLESPVRRRFTKDYKRDILQQVAPCTKDGEVGGILRREGRYSSIVSTWRQKEKQGLLTAPATGKRTANPAAPDASMPPATGERATQNATVTSGTDPRDQKKPPRSWGFP